MNIQTLHNLKESYLNIYDPIQRELDYYIDELIEEGYDINEYSDEELLESFLIERKNQDPKGIAYKAGINKPDDWGPPTPFGQAATRGSLARGIQGVRSLKQRGVRINRHHRNKYLAYKVHQGWSGAAQNSPHQTEAQKERRGKLIQPDLLSFRTNLPKRERDKDVPFVKKAERAANGRGEFASDSTPPQTERQKRLTKLQQAQRERNASRGVSETYNIYDEILEYLLDEGYVDNLESAENIMENMSEEWLYDILESYDLSEHTLDDMYKLYEASGGVIGGRFFRKKKPSNPRQKKSKRIADAIGSAIDRVMGYDIKPNRGPIDIPPEVRERYMRNRKRR